MTCVCCGDYVPEGSWVCVNCQNGKITAWSAVQTLEEAAGNLDRKRRRTEMSKERNYPTRMHEVLGVERDEEFIVKWNDCEKRYKLDSGYGIVFDLSTEDSEYRCLPAHGDDIAYMVNHPERITRKPRLTEEQVKRLRALIALEAMYLAKNKDGSVGAFISKPTKNTRYWNTNDSYVFYLNIVGTCLSDLVSWSDPEPLDIVQTLRQNGEEVEG